MNFAKYDFFFPGSKNRTKRELPVQFSLKVSQKRNEKLLMQKSCKTLQNCFDYERILVETAKICVGDGITLV